VILPAFQEVLDPSRLRAQVLDLVHGSSRLRALGLMDCRHPWEAGQTVSWAVCPTLVLPTDRENFHECQSVSVDHRVVTFRMKNIIIPAGTVSQESIPALTIEAGRLADLALVRDFREGDLGDPRLSYALDRIRLFPPGEGAPERALLDYRQEVARRFHESCDRMVFDVGASARPDLHPEPIRAIGTTTTETAPTRALTIDMIRQARDLLAQQPPSSWSPAFNDMVRAFAAMGMPRGDRNLPPFAPEPPTVEDLADGVAEQSAMAEMNTRPEAVPERPCRAPGTLPDCDTVAPSHAEPLAPLDDWMKKVDDLIEEVGR
jgi:hypothetical protein